MRLRPGRHALFLDFDDTLIPPQADPLNPRVPLELLRILKRLTASYDRYRVAIVSGRSLEQIDSFLAPLRLAGAGSHGAEIRFHPGRRTHRLAEPLPDGLRTRLRDLALRHGRSRLEDKPCAATLHTALGGGDRRQLDAAVERCLAPYQAGWRHRHWRRCIEISARHVSKGTAIAMFMRHAAYRGMVPVYVGDDAFTDHSLSIVEALGGQRIAVGCGPPRSPTMRNLKDTTRVRAFLRRLSRE